jgi:hypothetical protein
VNEHQRLSLALFEISRLDSVHIHVSGVLHKIFNCRSFSTSRQPLLLTRGSLIFDPGVGKCGHSGEYSESTDPRPQTANQQTQKG